MRKTYLQGLITPELRDSIALRNEQAQQVASLEALADEAAGDVNGDSNVDAALSDANDVGQEVEAVQAQTDDLERATGALESILTCMETREGGLTESEARFAAIACESAVGAWGIGESLLPSVESFGGADSRERATGKGIETIRDTLNRAYEWVKELFRKAGELIRDWYEKIFDVITKLINRAAKLKEKAGDIKGEAAERSIDAGVEIPKFSVEGKVPASPADMFRRLEKLFDCAAQTDAFAAKVEAESASALSELLVASDEHFEETVKRVEGRLEKQEPPAFFHKFGEGYQTDVFPGEVRYTAHHSGLSLRFEVKHGAGAARKSEDHGVGRATAGRGVKVAVMSKADILSAATEAANFGAKAKATRTSLRTANKGEESEILKAMRKDSKLSSGRLRTANATAQKVAGDAVSARKITIQMIMDGARAASAYLRLAEVSESRYKEGKAGSKPDVRELGHDKEGK